MSDYIISNTYANNLKTGMVGSYFGVKFIESHDFFWELHEEESYFLVIDL